MSVQRNGVTAAVMSDSEVRVDDIAEDIQEVPTFPVGMNTLGG